MNQLARHGLCERAVARARRQVHAGSTALIMLADPHSPAAEAYRSLAANLQFAYADRQLQTIGITSAARR